MSASECEQNNVNQTMWTNGRVILSFRVTRVIYLSKCVIVTLYGHCGNPDSKVGPILGRQDLGGPYVGPRNFAFWKSHDYFKAGKT